jgi:DNA-binding transcriptional MerR regulator
MNRKDFAKEVDINESTIIKYEKDFSLNIPRDENNYRNYGPKEIDIFNSIKNLRDANGITTITKIINEIQGNIEPDIQPPKEEVIKDTPDKENSPVYNLNETFNDLSLQLIANVENKLSSNTELSEMYGEVNQKLGFITALYLAEVEASKQSKRLLIEGNDEAVCNLKNELEEKKITLRDKDLKIAELEKELKEKERLEKENLRNQLEKERSKSWFTRLLGK